MLRNVHNCKSTCFLLLTVDSNRLGFSFIGYTKCFCIDAHHHQMNLGTDAVKDSSSQNGMNFFCDINIV